MTYLTLKISHTCTYRLTLLVVTGDQYHVWVQGVCHFQPVILRCILRYISCANAVHGSRPIKLRDQTLAMLDQSCPLPGPGPVVTSDTTGPGPGPGPLQSNIASVWYFGLRTFVGPDSVSVLLCCFCLFQPHFTSTTKKECKWWNASIVINAVSWT